MTKAELVDEVSENSGLTKQDAEVVVQTVLVSIVDALNSGEAVELRGFGSFRLRHRTPRLGRNPKTGQAVQVPAKRVPYFKPGKALRELINS
ncbi:integration host factor subunit beta [Acidobacteria bacterium AH-259-L09]|nr:integration host factor subunit beta [Acidobacteria bacterium AH-259-L09]